MNERHLNFRIISRHAQHHLVRHFLCVLRNERRKVIVQRFCGNTVHGGCFLATTSELFLGIIP